MRKKCQNDSGFTMIEMMVVLLIITVLLLIAVPNMVKNNEVAQSKGCDATINILEAQAGAYRVEHETPASALTDLKEGGYVETITCPDQTALTLNADGTVTKASE
ncbi:competence type IV pilus major pilin ComGC [Salibacterium halotolerans]|uniref:ComG operon protein 3 n=1 Tax=Salibacterium halotolerans TaxID=1884432 RepID=A0A1I5NKT8_9BACI|nr:competence type IV pilus major pilin ComGC [Salibacterium halotolerans]SFP22409.1 competence protein ComGC [Salibacterium halotolerans]